MPSAISRPAAAAHAKRITAALAPAVCEQVAADPKGAVEERFGIEVTIHAPGHTVAGSCGVHGLYIPSDPPTIEITQSLSRRRDGFTILHELGHHLIRHDATLVDELYGLPAQERHRSHELVADAIAGRLLIPDAAAAEVFVSGVTGPAVRRLFQETLASREACCVRAADALGQPGAVMLGRDNIAVFTAHHSTRWTVARDTPQAPDSILARAVNAGGRVTGVTRVQFRNGNMSQELYTDAQACDDGWVFAVFGSHRPPSGGLTVPIGEFEADEIECPACEIVFMPSGKPCSCGDYKCPNGHCSCQLESPTKVCTSCFQRKAINLFAAGSDICNDTCS